ncbi:MAG: hypothetical protein NTX72_02410 [Candidatus Uhrbacteria bacterium]|nr:hypothetical protein [Candidatus Uhrbacteria bacterium]
MKKLFALTLVGIALTGFGCSKPVTSQPTPPIVTQATPGIPVPVIPAGWQTFTDVADHFRISYPADKAILLLNADPIQLPRATGEKSRMMRVNVVQTPKKDPGSCDREKTYSANATTLCVSVENEGAAGSTYRTYTYALTNAIEQPSKTTEILFTIQYPTDVRVYGGCETEVDLQTQKCKDLAFDEVRDTQLFTQIMDTFVYTNP